jgi:hypothetical protein
VLWRNIAVASALQENHHLPLAGMVFVSGKKWKTPVFSLDRARSSLPTPPSHTPTRSLPGVVGWEGGWTGRGPNSTFGGQRLTQHQQGGGDRRCFRRPQDHSKRTRRVEVLLSEQEHAALVAAAEHARMARAAFVARAVHHAITGRERPEFTLLRELLTEVAKMAGQVARIGVNLNQAVAALHSTGQVPGNLLAYAAAAHRVLDRVDDLADELHRALS